MPLNTEYERRTPIVCRFRTNDVDEAREFVGRRFGEHTRVPLARGPLGLELSVSAGRRCIVGHHTAVVPCTVRAVTHNVLVHLPLQHGATYRVGRRALRSSPEVAVLLAPGHDYSVTMAPGGAAGALMIDAELVASELQAAAKTGGGHWSLRSVELPLAPDQRAEFVSLSQRHAEAVRTASCSFDFATLVQVERELAIWLAGRIAQSGASKPLSTSSRRAAELVETWVRQHAAQPVTLEQQL